jgi:AcrR family transcriptional regulator
MSHEQDHALTRKRLLEAAGEVFAEKGFRCATVRDICQRAGANVAAVNYHFGDKEKLYAEVLHLAHACAQERYPEGFEAMPGATPEQRLRALIGSFLRRLLDEGRPAWQGKLMAREMTDPTPALNVVVDRLIRHDFERVVEVVRQIAGEQHDANSLRRCAASIIGQCLFYRHAAPVVQRITPELKYDPPGIEYLADHITQFSLAALKHMRPARKDVQS